MNKPWKTLRCVVEVKVPPSNASDEKDLIYHVEKALFQHGKFPGILAMPRSHHPERYDAKPKVKSYVRVRQAERPAAPSFEWLVLRALSFIFAMLAASPRSREPYREWCKATSTYLGVPMKEEP
jgi:hypothetical protein